MYNEHEYDYRDDELYHHGRKGQKWEQHIFSTAKNVATRAAKRAVANATPAVKMLNKHGKQGIQFLKDNPQFAYGVALPAAAFAGRATYQAVKKHNRIKRQEKQEKAKRTRIYDRSSGNYWHLKKELTNKQWLEVNKRKKAVEKTGDILKSMKVLKK